jgi:hypothetical protein
MWLWRTAGGWLMVASHLVFVVKVCAMQPGLVLAAVLIPPTIGAWA